MTEWLRRRPAGPTPPPAKSTSSSSYSGPPTPKILSGGSWKPPPPIFYKPPPPVLDTGAAVNMLPVAAPNSMPSYVISSVGRVVAKTKAPSKSGPPLGPPAGTTRDRSRTPIGEVPRVRTKEVRREHVAWKARAKDPSRVPPRSPRRPTGRGSMRGPLSQYRVVHGDSQSHHEMASRGLSRLPDCSDGSEGMTSCAVPRSQHAVSLFLKTYEASKESVIPLAAAMRTRNLSFFSEGPFGFTLSWEMDYAG